MTSPNIGQASVDVVANVDEQEFAQAARKAGDTGGKAASDSFSKRFAERLRKADDKLLQGGFGTRFARRLDRVAEQGATRFATRFGARLRRLDDRLFASMRTGFLRQLDDTAISGIRRLGGALRSLDDAALRDLQNVPDAFRRLGASLRSLDDRMIARVRSLGASLRDLDDRAINRVRVALQRIADLDVSGPLASIDFGGRLGRAANDFSRGLAGQGDALRKTLRELREKELKEFQKDADARIRHEQQIYRTTERQLEALRVSHDERMLRFEQRLRRARTDSARAQIEREMDDLDELTQERTRRLERIQREAYDRLAGAAQDRERGTDERRGRMDRDQDVRNFERLGTAMRAAAQAGGFLGRGLGTLLSPLGAVWSATRRYVIILGALAGASLFLVRPLGNFAISLRETLGLLVGLPALLVGAAGTFAVFKAGADGLKESVKELEAGWQEFSKTTSDTFRTLREDFRAIAQNEMPAVYRGLGRLATGFRDLIRSQLDAFDTFNGGNALEGFFTNLGTAIQNLRPGLVAVQDLLLQMATEVGAVLPRLATEFSTFLEAFRARQSSLDFGQIFERGVRGAKNLIIAIKDALGAITDFAAAATGRDSGTSTEPFQGLRDFFRDLRTDIRENRQAIYDFFEGVDAFGRGLKSTFTFLKDSLQPTFDYFKSPEFKEGLALIRGEAATGPGVRPTRREYVGREPDGTQIFREVPTGPSPLAQDVGAAFKDFVEFLVTNGPTIVETLKGMATAVQVIAKGASAIDSVFTTLKAFNDATSLSNEELSSGSQFDGLIAGLGRVKTAFTDLFTQDGQTNDTFFGRLGRDIRQGTLDAGAALGEFAASIPGRVSGAMSTIRSSFTRENLAGVVRGVFSRISPTAAAFIPGFGAVMRRFAPQITAAGTSMRTAAERMRSRLREILNTLGEIGRRAVSDFVRGFAFRGSIGDGIVSALRGLWERIMEWVRRIASIRIKLPSIPKFNPPGDFGGADNNPFTARANGGFINRPEVALIGEAGPELVLPLSRPSRTQELLEAAGLADRRATAGPTRVTTINAPITVQATSGQDPTAIAMLTSRRLAALVR